MLCIFHWGMFTRSPSLNNTKFITTRNSAKNAHFRFLIYCHVNRSTSGGTLIITCFWMIMHAGSVDVCSGRCSIEYKRCLELQPSYKQLQGRCRHALHGVSSLLSPHLL